MFFIAIVIGKETMSSDEFYKSYFIVPLYNVSVNKDIINMEPITREILEKFIKNYLETQKSLEKIAQSLDKSVFQKLAEK